MPHNDSTGSTAAKYQVKTLVINGISRSIQQTAPTPDGIGHQWDEIDTYGNLILEWFWNGTYWLSRKLYQFSAGMNGGANLTTTTGGFPFCPGTTYDFFLIKVIGNFYTTGTLSATNFWRLRFALNALTATMYVDFTSNTGGNANFVTGEVTFNTKLTNPKTAGGYWNHSFEIHGSAPNVSSGNTTIEYRLVHP